MDTRQLIPAIFLAACLAGCATTAKPASKEAYSHNAYQPTATIVDKVAVNMPFDRAWNTLVQQLAANYFAVEQIDKESRFISINASQDAGGIGRDSDWWLAYARCGTSQRHFVFDDTDYRYEYEILSTTPYTTVFENAGYSFWDEIVPVVNAEIRMNIYLSPIDATRTEISVNARYRFSRTLGGQRFSLRNDGKYRFSTRLSDRTSTVTFTSQSPGQYPSTNTPITCYSTGRFESAVVDLLQAAR